MQTDKFKRMMERVEDVLAAASFAEAGESGAARSLIADGQRVLLALKQGRIDRKTVKYAVNTARRIGAGLDILYVVAGDGGKRPEDPALRAFEAELASEAVPYRLLRKTGCLKRIVIDYTNREKDILFAVVESPRSLNADCNRKETRLSELWQKLKCPLVVVMDGAGAASHAGLFDLETINNSPGGTEWHRIQHERNRSARWPPWG